MNQNIEVYLGDQIEVESEQRFLERVASDLSARGIRALILANFFAGKSQRQVDFLVVAERAFHVELKNWPFPLFGKANGPWSQRLPDGSLKTIGRENPHHQTLHAKYAILDDMKRMVSDSRGLCVLPGEPDYKEIESVICVYPGLAPGSNVYQDYKVWVKSYDQLLQAIRAKKSPRSWTLDHWRLFATHLGLVRQDDDGTTATTSIADDYTRRFRDLYSSGLHELVPTDVRTNAQVVRSEALLSFLRTGKHAQLIGRSGCGKSHLAKHMALRAIADGVIPIFASAKAYRGKLSPLLDRSVAPCVPHNAVQFIQAVREIGSPLALVIDGYNECPPKFRGDLLKDLQALYVRWAMPIVLTSHDPIDVPAALNGDRFQFDELSVVEKRSVFASYAGTNLSDADCQLLAPFGTSFDISLAAQCFKELPAQCTRSDLLRAYIDRCLSRTSNVAMVRSALMALAELMGREWVGVISLTEFCRIAGELSAGGETSPMDLEQIFDSGLLTASQGYVSFRHEQFQYFFEAEALLKATQGGDLADQLSKPARAHLREFVLAAMKDADNVSSCLRAIADANTLVACIRGQVGNEARTVVLRDVTNMLRRSELHPPDWSGYLRNIEIALRDGDEITSLLKDAEDAKQAERYDNSIIGAIGLALGDGLFIDEVMTLLADTDAALDAIANAAPQRERNKVANQLFWSVYVGGCERSYHAGPIVRAYHNNFWSTKSAAVEGKVVSMWSNPRTS